MTTRSALRAWLVFPTLLLAVGCGAGTPSGGAGSGGATGPAKASVGAAGPTGLFFMTRFWASSGSLEMAVVYFSPEGRVYRNPQGDFTPSRLEADSARHGSFRMDGKELEVTWSDGKKTRSTFTPSGKGFSWDAGIFTPVAPIEGAASIAGTWEGGHSLAGGAGQVAVSRTLTLAPDGSFVMTGIGSVASKGDAGTVTAASSGERSGKWSVNSYALTLTDGGGVAETRIAFPYDDASTAVKPDRLYVDGTMFKKQ